MIGYVKTLEVKISTDVFIAGGGPAGVAAAIACRAQGKKVFIAESSGCFGGSSTQALVPELMNFDDGINFVSGGVGKMVHSALYDDIPSGRRWYVVQSEKIKRLYDDLIKQSGADFLFFSRVVDVVLDGEGHVSHAIVASKTGLYAIEAKVFIDCTGDGSLCAFAGADFEYGGINGAIAPSTLCSVWGGINFKEKNVVFDGDMLPKANADGVFSQFDGLLPGIKETDPERGIGGGNVGHCFGVNDIDEKSLTDAMLFGRKSMLEFEIYYKNYLKGFENIALQQTANVLGVRESRRIIGDIIMTKDYFTPDYTFPDEIGRYFYPVDIHPETPDQKGMNEFLENVRHDFAPGESYSISYRALTPKKLDNVFVAGRCVSADRAMQASMRVIPCCYITGQASGIAAAVCCDSNTDVHSADISDIQSRLRKFGAYLY